MLRVSCLVLAVASVAAGCSDHVSERSQECLETGSECGLIRGKTGTVDCGPCAEGQICGAFERNRCALCTPKSCEELGAACGDLEDGCGGHLSCGTCAAGERCGNVEPNRCSPCGASACSDAKAECGIVPDGCGGTVDCGSCGIGEICYERHVCSTCDPARCEPTDCGPKEDGCGGTLDCGVCPTPSTIRVIPLGARAMVADRSRGMLYVAGPGTTSPGGDGVRVVNLASGSVERTILLPEGSDPAVMALAPDNRTLWVGFGGTNQVVQLELDSDAVVQTIELPEVMQFPTEHHSVAQSILVSPADPSIVVIGVADSRDTSGTRALVAYRDGAQVGDPIRKYWSEVSWVFEPTGVTLYGIDGHLGRLYGYHLGSDGLTESFTTASALEEGATSCVVDDGRLHCSNGRVYGLEEKRIVGTLAGTGLFDHESEADRSYFLPQRLDATFARPVITVFDSRHFVPIDTVDLGFPKDRRVQSIARYGEDGLALLLGEDELWLIESTGL